jgi:AraC-like DNA-binding protein
MSSRGQQDPLGEALHFLRMSGLFYCHSEFTAPWGLALPPADGCAHFHIVTSGRAILEGPGIDPRILEAGDLVLVPHGDGHRLADDPASPAVQLEHLPAQRLSDQYGILRHGGGGRATDLVCVTVRFDHPAAFQLIALLPKVIHVRAERSREPEWLDPMLRLVASETRSLRPGGETIVKRLADVLVIQAIRWWIEHDPDAQVGWLRALRDRQIGRALVLIHRELARSWTIASLAAEVAMSRSAFAARFTDLVGEPVMRYLARSRMYAAFTSLKVAHVDLGDLASRFGYESEAAFNRAFKRFTGTTPGAVRRSPAEPSQRVVRVEHDDRGASKALPARRRKGRPSRTHSVRLRQPAVTRRTR